jgi:hypothetical protein
MLAIIGGTSKLVRVRESVPEIVNIRCGSMAAADIPAIPIDRISLRDTLLMDCASVEFQRSKIRKAKQTSELRMTTGSKYEIDVDACAIHKIVDAH